MFSDDSFNHRIDGKGRNALHVSPSAIALLASLPILSACAPWTTTASPSKLRSPDTYSATTVLSGTQADFPTDDWWLSFDDSQLDQLIAEARQNSPTISEATARIRSAQAMVGTSRATLYPDLTAGGAALPGKLPESLVGQHTDFKTFGVAGLNFSWELDFWGKNRDAVRAASSEAKASQADAASATLMLTTTIASTYVDLYGLYLQRDVASAAVRIRQETSDIVRLRFNQGLDNESAFRQAESAEETAVADLAGIDESISLNKNQIATLVGAGPDRGIAISPPSLGIEKEWGLPTDLPTQLIGRKPEIVAARWRVEAAARRVGIAKANFYPNVNLMGLAGFIAPSIDNLFKAQSSGEGIGPAITLPIFDGGKLNSKYSGALADYDLAVASYNDAIVQALHETADAVISLRALSARRTPTDRALAQQEVAYGLARMRYGAGLSDYASVLVAENALLNARSASTDLRVRSYRLNVALIRSLGGGFRSQPLPVAGLTP